MPRFPRAQIVDRLIQLTPADRPTWQRYVFAIGLVAAGVALGLALGPGPGTAVLLLAFYGPAVLLAAWFGGLGPGLVATALCTLVAALFAGPAAGAGGAGGLIRHLALLLTGGAISVLGEVLHEARRHQEQGAARVQRLAELQVQLDDVAIALAEALQVPQVAEIAVVQGCALLGASAGTLAVLDEASGRLRPVYSVGYPPEAQADRVIEIHSEEPLAEAVRGLAPVVVESRQASDARYPHLARVRDLTGTEAVAALPLVVQGRVLGGFGFSFREPQRFRQTDLPLMQALAYQAALALESARRYGKEQEAREQAEASSARHRFAAEANAGLAASMDYRANLREVARLSVPAFADGCLVHLRSGDGGLGLLAGFHADERLGAALADLGGRQTELAEGEDGFWHAFHSRRPELLAEAAKHWAARARDETERALLAQLGLGSSLSVPLVARDRSLGALTFVTTREGNPLDEEDLRLALELADRAAAAVDNALLFEEAQRLNRVKDEFLALLSHELRTPLGSVLVWLDLLRAEPLDLGAGHAAEMIHRSARQLAELIDQLLDVSRIVTGKLSVEKQATDLAAVVVGVLEAAAPVAEAKGVHLQANVCRGLKRIWADPNRLRQALTNLVLNAVKFTPAGGEVGVRLDQAGGLARIEVRDTGVGISRDLLPFVFEPFRQGDTRSTRTHGGLGLGLSLARHVAEQHDGRIRASSGGPGQGSVFTMDLPASMPAQVAAAPAAGAHTAESSLASLRVLLVDDHEETLHGLALGLSASGAEVTPVSSAREALAEMPRLRPDVLVSDLAMPEQDGYALIGEIRSLAPEAGGRIPAVAVSAYASPDDRLRALRAGYHEHVAKPVELARLVSTIARLANRSQA